jgi:hypothetical protein
MVRVKEGEYGQCSPYIYEVRTLKHVEIILSRGKGVEEE